MDACGRGKRDTGRSVGVNTLVAGYPGGDGSYIEAMNSFGNKMDWWPAFEGDNPANIVRIMAENPAIAAQIVGYSLDDEPDMASPYRPPSLLRTWAHGLRRLDSTRPFQLGMGRVAIRNQSFIGAPQGSTPQVQNELWREWTGIADLITCDDYTLTPYDDPAGVWGIWCYADHVGRMDEITDKAKPMWDTIETTVSLPNQPEPEDTRKAIWATLIAGARGILLFDHRFANDFVTQDFAAMLHDPPMRAMITALSARVQTLGPALLATEAKLVTASTSSNTTAGPIGGTYGVPLHYTTRIGSGGKRYLFAMGIRPGATNATFTIPSWAGLTVTVLDENRTVTVSPAGVLTDTFAADYTTHLYEAPPPPTITGLSVTPPTASVAVGTTQQLTATGALAGGGTSNFSGIAAWASSDPTKATVSSTGLVTAVAEGSVSITATASGFTDDCAVTVTPPNITGISVTPATAALAPGGAQQCTATANLSGGGTLDVTSTATWTSGTPAVATVSSTGRITAVAAGTSSVTATRSGFTDDCAVTVTPAYNSIRLPTDTYAGAANANPSISVGVRIYRSPTGTARTLYGARVWRTTTSHPTPPTLYAATLGGPLLGFKESPTDAPGAAGWETILFDTPIPLDTTSPYLVWFRLPGGGYPATNSYFINADRFSQPNPVYGCQADVAGCFIATTGSTQPTTFLGTFYWVDPLVT